TLHLARWRDESVCQQVRAMPHSASCPGYVPRASRELLAPADQPSARRKDGTSEAAVLAVGLAAKRSDFEVEFTIQLWRRRARSAIRITRSLATKVGSRHTIGTGPCNRPWSTTRVTAGPLDSAPERIARRWDPASR